MPALHYAVRAGYESPDIDSVEAAQGRDYSCLHGVVCSFVTVLYTSTMKTVAVLLATVRTISTLLTVICSCEAGLKLV